MTISPRRSSRMPIDPAVFGVVELVACFDSMMLNAPRRSRGLAVTMMGAAILTDLRSDFPIVSWLLTFW